MIFFIPLKIKFPISDFLPLFNTGMIFKFKQARKHIPRDPSPALARSKATSEDTSTLFGILVELLFVMLSPSSSFKSLTMTNPYSFIKRSNDLIN